MVEYPFLPYSPHRLSPEEMQHRAESFYRLLSQRRSVRHFAAEWVPRPLIAQAIATASTAPSGANRQPWTFVAISDGETKRRIRLAAEAEERISYEKGRMPREWREAVAHLKTDWHKPFLETAPWLVVVFEQTYGVDAQQQAFKNYYVKESVGIACGLFIAALHNMGLATLPHTPSPLSFLTTILARPANEKPFVLFPIGFPAADAEVPDQTRKALDQVAVWVEPPSARPPRGSNAPEVPQ